MKKIIGTIATIIIALVIPQLSQAKILFYDDCENAWVLKTDWNEANTHQGSNYAVVSTEHARSGTHSYKFHVQAFDPNNKAATNCGLKLRAMNSPVQIKNFLFDRVYWMGFSVYIPSGYSWPSSSRKLADGYGEWQLLWQTHGLEDPCGTVLNPNIGGFVGASKYNVTIKGDARDCITKPYQRNASYSPTIGKGAWHDIVLHFKFSYDSTGFFEMWIDGNWKFKDTGMNCFKQSKGPYFIMGPYGHMGDAVDTYYDEIRVGDNNSSFAEVSPTGGSTVNQPPIFSSMAPSTTQTIAAGQTVTFSSAAYDPEGGGIDYRWTFDSSGIGQSIVASPGALQFNSPGTFNVQVIATDNQGLSTSKNVTVIVTGGGSPITGLVNRYDFEFGAITTDTQGNQDLTNNGPVAVGAGGTEPDPPGYGSWEVSFNGTSQYFSISSWGSSNPWQPTKPWGCFAACLKTPATLTGGEKYLLNNYDVTNNKRIAACILENATYRPTFKIGTEGGSAHEDGVMGSSLQPSHIYTIFYIYNNLTKTWQIAAYDNEADAWLDKASGKFIGEMNLASSSLWNIGRRSDGFAASYFPGDLYWSRIYNVIPTDGEMVDIAKGAYEEPAAAGDAIESWCWATGDGECVSSNYSFHRREKICANIYWPTESASVSNGSYDNIRLHVALNGSGSLDLKYQSGANNNVFTLCDIVDIGDRHVGDLDLGTVNDLQLDAMGGAAVTVRGKSGNELDPTFPTIEAPYDVSINGLSNILWVK